MLVCVFSVVASILAGVVVSALAPPEQIRGRIEVIHAFDGVYVFSLDRPVRYQPTAMREYYSFIDQWLQENNREVLSIDERWEGNDGGRENCRPRVTLLTRPKS